MLKKFALGALALSLVSAPTLAAFDVGGIEIGKSMEAQREAIAALNPDYQIQELKLTTGEVAGLEAVASKDGKVQDHFLVMQDAAGDVWYVGRAQGFAEGERIEPEVLKNSLIEKYGEYTEFTVGNNGPIWHYDRDGKLYRGAGVHGPCFSMGRGDQPFNKVLGVALTVPRSFNPTCGVEIKTFTSVDPADQMIQAFSVQIFDEKRMYDELNAAAVAKEKERQQQLEAEKAKSNKPKL